MRALYAISLLFVFSIITSCHQQPREYSINLNGDSVKVSLAEGEINYLQCFVGDSMTSSWPLRYPVFQFLKGDVNGDGAEDVAVGVIKTTRRDPVIRKRLFLFQVRNNTIIPLWLGSSLSHPLEDFNIIQRESGTAVRAIEKDKHKYLVAEYEWLGFGLKFRTYLKREISLAVAKQMLNE